MTASSTRGCVRAVVLSIIVSFLLTSCAGDHYSPDSHQASVSESSHHDHHHHEEDLCAQVDRLPLREKLAQLLMVGVRDTADASAVIHTYHVGGIFLGSWTDLDILSAQSRQQLADSHDMLPLAISVDEEGGRVSRLGQLIGSSPPAAQLARHDSEDMVYQLALHRGQQMHQLGITIDFAPVVDIVSPDTDPDSVIGDRAFGSDVDTVTRYAKAYAQGLRDAGVLPVLKHFPGHGHAVGDSHVAGLVQTPPLDQLIHTDLVPYRTLLTYSPVGVMIGHLSVPGLTNGQPASVSPQAVHLLREGIGYGGPAFDGVIFSDDLSSMAAINQHYSLDQAVLTSLQAGVDMALWVSTEQVGQVLTSLEHAYHEGQLPNQTLGAALHRIVKMKNPQAHCGVSKDPKHVEEDESRS